MDSGVILQTLCRDSKACGLGSSRCNVALSLVWQHVPSMGGHWQPLLGNRLLPTWRAGHRVGCCADKEGQLWPFAEPFSRMLTGLM